MFSLKDLDNVEYKKAVDVWDKTQDLLGGFYLRSTRCDGSALRKGRLLYK